MKKDKYNLELVLSSVEALAAYKTVKSLLYAQNITKCAKHNILNLKLMLFHLKHKASTKQLSVTGFFGKVYFSAGINITLSCLFFFVGCSENVCFSFFVALFCLLHIVMLSCNHRSPTFITLFPWSPEKQWIEVPM
jgi:hypothetical protein